MKKSILCVLICLVFVPNFVSAKLDPKDPMLCKVNKCKPPKKGAMQTCQCYCAAKGGPRDWVEGDTGYIPSDDEVTPKKPKICYCRKWDFDNAPKATEAEAQRHIDAMKDKKTLGRNVK